jgi:hypothetical protein
VRCRIEKRKSLAPTGNRNSPVQPVARHYTYRAFSATLVAAAATVVVVVVVVVVTI